MQGSQQIQDCPEESREAAALVIKQYGESDEISASQLIWHRPGPWKRIVASKGRSIRTTSRRRTSTRSSQ
jgi:hypothetical protein